MNAEFGAIFSKPRRFTGSLNILTCWCHLKGNLVECTTLHSVKHRSCVQILWYICVTHGQLYTCRAYNCRDHRWFTIASVTVPMIPVETTINMYMSGLALGHFLVSHCGYRISFILATNEFVEPQKMFVKGINNFKFGSKDSKQDTHIYICLCSY